MNEDQITLINDDGTEQLANILFTHEHDGSNYVVFEFVESGEISAAKYIEDKDGMGTIEAIETDEEWEMLDEVLEGYYDELDDQDDLDEEDEDEEEDTRD